MLLAGRLGNLLVYLALAALAAALCPRARRGLLACAALLPQTLQLAASFSADATVLGLVFSFTALCLRLRLQPARRWQLALLVALALAIGPAKAIYLPVVLLLCLVPAAHLDPRGPQAAPLRLGRISLRAGTLVKALALALAAAGWAALNLGAVLYATRDVDNVGLTRAAVAVAIAAAVLAFVYFQVRRRPLGRKVFFGVLIAGLCVAVPVALYRLTHMWGGLTPEQLVGSVQPNGDSIYTYSAGYICRNLPATVKLLLRSASAQGAAWLQGLLGHGARRTHRLPRRGQLGARRGACACAAGGGAAAGGHPAAAAPCLRGRLGHRGLRCRPHVLCRPQLDADQLRNDLRRAGALLAARAAAGARSFGQRPHVHGAAQRCAPGGAGNRLPHISGHPAGRGSLRGLADVINA